MAENPILVRFEIKQPKVKEDLEEIISSTEGFQLDNSGTAVSCDLLILRSERISRRSFSWLTISRTREWPGKSFLPRPVWIRSS